MANVVNETMNHHIDRLGDSLYLIMVAYSKMFPNQELCPMGAQTETQQSNSTRSSPTMPVFSRTAGECGRAQQRSAAPNRLGHDLESWLNT